MKRFLKTPLIFVLALTVFAFSIYCCCLVHPAQAKEETPTCHQTEQSQEQSHNPEECDCPAFMGIVLQGAEVDIHLALLNITNFSDILQHSGQQYTPEFPESLSAHKAPLALEQSLPLYLKHSILRL